MALVNQDLYLEITPGTIPPILNVTEYDENMQVVVHLRERGQAYEIPSGVTAKVEGTLTGHPFRVDATPASGEDTVTFELSEAMTGYAGRAWTKLKLVKDNKPVHTCGFWLNCDRAGVEAGDVVAMTGFEQQLKDDVYDYLDEKQLASIAFLPHDLLASGSLNDCTAPGYWLLSGGNTYTDCPLPSGHAGLLCVYPPVSSTITQVLYDLTASKVSWQRSSRSGSFSDRTWSQMTGESLLVQPTNSYTSCDSVNESCILFNNYNAGVTTFSDYPFDAAGWLITIKSFSDLSTKLQIAIKYMGFSVKFRTCNVNGVWSAWSTGGGGEVLSSCDLNTVIGGGIGFYLLISNNSYTHTPEGLGTGFLLKLTAGDWTYQIFFSLTDHRIWSRTYGLGVVDGVTTPMWRNEWARLGGSSGGGNHYENTYNITCNPTITTDTNNYLASPGDTTDMTGAIQTMLNTTGACNLSPGDFYVTGIEIPNNGTLRGSGTKTRLILAPSVTDGYAVKLKTHSCVQDLEIIGQTSEYTPVADTGKRDGIIFEGTADAESGAVTHYRSTVQNVVISDFHGSGVRCENTGGKVDSSCHFTDLIIYRCDVGVNVAYYSEYHRWTAVSVTLSYYGAIVNGGNNNFANCDFSGNTIGLLIDDSAGTSRNNSHGTFSACSFNHSGANSGTAIRILGADNGEVFTGCQIFYGAIEIDSSTGIRFIGANIGRAVPISVTNSKVVSFSDCTMFSAAEDPITQSGNTAFVVDKCYYYTGAEVSV